MRRCGRLWMAWLSASVFYAAPLMGEQWRVKAEKQPSPVSQQRNVRIERRARNEATAWLVIACHDGSKLLRIARNYSLANGIDSAINKSRLERAIQKGEQYERYGFAWHASGDKRMVKVRWRFAGDSTATERDFPAGYSGGTHFAILDADIAPMLAKLRAEPKLFVEVPERTGGKSWEFELGGLAAALGKAKAAGCVP